MLPRKFSSKNWMLADGLLGELSDKKIVFQECLRQSRWSFNVHLSITAASAAIIIAGAGLLLSGKVSEGTFMTIGGVSSNIVSVRSMKMTREARDKLCEMAKEFSDEAREERPLN